MVLAGMGYRSILKPTISVLEVKKQERCISNGNDNIKMCKSSDSWLSSIHLAFILYFASLVLSKFEKYNKKSYSNLSVLQALILVRYHRSIESMLMLNENQCHLLCCCCRNPVLSYIFLHHSHTLYSQLYAHNTDYKELLILWENHVI